MAGVLRQPDPSIVTPRKAAAVLRHLGLDWAAEPGFVPTPLPPVVPLKPRDPRDWWVGEDAIVTYRGAPEDFPTGGAWSCDRDPLSEGRCWEVAAAILVHCWNREDLRPLFEQPSWSLDLLDLMRPTRTEEPPERRRGWLRYELRDDDPHDSLPLRRSLVRLSRRDGQPLKPRPMPETLDEVEARINGVTDTDRTIHDVICALDALRRPPVTMATEEADAARARLRARGFHALLDTADLWFRGAPLGTERRAHHPVLRARDGADGIELAWRDRVDATWTAGPGYVVADGVLRPLAATHLARDPELLTAELPVVPFADAAAFVDRFVLQSGVAMELDSTHLPPTRHPDALVGRLRLDEVEDGLQLDVRVDYHIAAPGPDAEPAPAPALEGGSAPDADQPDADQPEPDQPEPDQPEPEIEPSADPTSAEATSADAAPHADAALDADATPDAAPDADAALDAAPQPLDAPTAVLTVDPAHPEPQARLGGALVRRDPDAERALVDTAERALGCALPTRLGEDAALGVLLDGLPALPPDWVVEGTDRLRRFRIAGRLAPRVSVPSGIDWLDLRIDFTIGDQAVSIADVLESWRAGERFYRLPDGTLARLPDAWLARHGAHGEEVEALRAAAGGRLHAHAAPLVAELLEQAQGDRDRWALVKARLDAFDNVPDRPPPEGLVAELRVYQKAGYRWLCWLRDLGLGGVLADDMGLGKTVQALALLLDTHRDPGPPSLVVAPTSVIYNWAEEAARFTPSLRVHVHHGPARPAEPPPDADLVITSYALLRTDETAFDRPWRVVVLDEAQRIKNPQSRVARAARELVADHRFALTGTPLENHLLELWSIFEALMPGFFGGRAAFQRRYALPIERDRDEAALAALRVRLRPFVLRRLKSEVATELPPRQEQILYCELGPAQRRLYERVKATYREAVLRRVDSLGLARATLPVLEALMRLRQACCDPGLLPFPEAREVDESAKLELLIETLEETIAEDHRTLVFSQWTSLLKRVAPLLDARGWSYLYLDGGTRDRQSLVKRWNDPEGPPVFLVSLKAGGAGLNLTGADHVIHLDPWWNPAVEDQATDRAHRIGQTRPVVAYKLVARDTVEEKVLALQARKRALFDAAVDQGRFRVEQLTREDIEAVLAVDDPEATPLGPAIGGEPNVPEADRADDAPAAPAAPAGDPAVLLETDERLTNARVRKMMGWGADEARAWLRAQVDAGRLIKRGRKRGTWYERVGR